LYTLRILCNTLRIYYVYTVYTQCIRCVYTACTLRTVRIHCVYTALTMHVVSTYACNPHNFISTTKTVFVLSSLDLIYGHATHILQQPSDIPSQLSQLSFRHVSGILTVTLKENRQYCNNVSLFPALNVRHIVIRTHLLSTADQAASCSVCSVTAQRHTQSV